MNELPKGEYPITVAIKAVEGSSLHDDTFTVILVIAETPYPEGQQPAKVCVLSELECRF